MYIETSYPRRAGDNATMEKSGITFTGNTCVRFFYHMYGNSMGTLNVLVGDEKVFTRSGNQGNKWIEARVRVPSKGTYSVSISSKLYLSVWFCYTKLFQYRELFHFKLFEK